MPTTIPNGGSSRARRTSAPSGSAGRRRPGRAAPEAVRRERPDADQREQQHDLLQQRIDRAVGDQDGGDGVAQAESPTDVPPPPRRERAARGRQQQHQRRERRGNQRGEQQPRQGAEPRAGRSATDRRPRLGASGRPRRSAGRRSRRCRSPPRSAPRPGAASRTQASASSSPKATKPTTAANASRAAIGPDGQAEHQQRPGRRRAPSARRHACGPPRRTARAISWVTVAPANWASSQTRDKLQRRRAGRRPEAAGRARPGRGPRLSALVSACRRRQRVGKAQQPDRSGQEEEGAGARPQEPSTTSSARLIGSVASAGRSGAHVDEGDRDEGGEQRQRSARHPPRRAARSPAPAAAAPRCRRCPATAPPSCGRHPPGPRRMRTSPSATIASMKPAAASRNSAMVGRPADAATKQCFVRRQLRRDRLADIEAMHQKRSALRRCRPAACRAAGSPARETRRAPYQAAGRARYVTKPGRNGSRGSSARRATSIPATSDWRGKRSSEPGKASWRQTRSAGRQQSAGWSMSRTQPQPPRQEISGIAAGKNQPEDKKSAARTNAAIAGQRCRQTTHGVTTGHPRSRSPFMTSCRERQRSVAMRLHQDLVTAGSLMRNQAT